MRLVTSLLAGAAGLAAGAAPALATGQAKTVRGLVITSQPRTAAPGTAVKASRIIGQRVFVDARHGFALVDRNQAQYPAATADGGETWRTDGPALHVDAAQGPLAVTTVGALDRRTIFAYGAGNVVDVTTDGGRRWRRGLWGYGTPMAVVGNSQGDLVAFVDISGPGATPVSGPTWQYVSRDGGRSWHYTTRLGGS